MLFPPIGSFFPGQPFPPFPGQGPADLWSDGPVPLFLRACALRYYGCPRTSGPTTTDCPSPLASSSFTRRYRQGRSAPSFCLILPDLASHALGAGHRPGLLISRLPFAASSLQRPSLLADLRSERSRMSCRTCAPLSVPGRGVGPALGAPPLFFAFHYCSRSHNSESLLHYYFFRGSITRLLYSLSSDLRSAASLPLSLRRMQDSLPVTCQVFPDEVLGFPRGLIRSCCKVLPVSSFHELP